MLLDKYPGITDQQIAEKTGLDVEDVAEHVGILMDQATDESVSTEVV